MTKICVSIGDGIHGTPIFSDSGDYSFINGSNLFAGHISLLGTKKCKKDEYVKYSENKKLFDITQDFSKYKKKKKINVKT